MPVTYKIDPNLNLIYYAGFGLCSGGEFLSAERDAFNNPLRTPEMKIIIDIRFAELDLDLGDVRALIKLNRQLANEGRNLEKTAIFSKSSIFTTLGDAVRLMADDIPLKMGIFHNPNDALKWLDLPDAMERVSKIGESLLQVHKNEEA